MDKDIKWLSDKPWSKAWAETNGYGVKINDGVGMVELSPDEQAALLKILRKAAKKEGR